MAVWGGLTNSCKKKKSKREKEIYTHLNAEFQKIARETRREERRETRERNKRSFLSDQCKERGKQ